MFSNFKKFFQNRLRVCNKVMIKRSTTSNLRCYTTLQYIVNHNTCFTLFLFFWH